MATYLDLINRARSRNGDDKLNEDTFSIESREALSSLEFLREVIGVVHMFSTDIQTNERVREVSTVINNGVLSQNVGDPLWDNESIKRMRLIDGVNRREIQRITVDEAYRIAPSLSPGEPIYFYNDEGEVKILPVPQAVYEIEVRYQGDIPEINAENISSTVGLSSFLRETIVDGILAHILKDNRDPEWEKQDQDFKRKLKIAYRRNNIMYKKRGINKLYKKSKSWSF